MNNINGLVGHDGVLKHIRSAVSAGRVSHAYLIEGAEGSGKKTLANRFAMTLLCKTPQDGEPCGRCDSCRVFLSGNHPDMHYIRPGEKGTLPVQMIRDELVQDIEVLPYYEGRKVYIVENAHMMKEQAQNVLLKTIEEPPAYGVVLLLAESVQNFLPTVRSRCVLLRLLPLSERLVAQTLVSQYQVAPEIAASCSAFCGGSVGQALKMAQSEEFVQLRGRWMQRFAGMVREDMVGMLGWSMALEEDKAHIQEVLRMMMIWFRDLLLVMETGSTGQCICQDMAEALSNSVRMYDIAEVYRKIDVLNDAQRKLSHNVNYALWCDWLLIQLSKHSTQR
ncbi:MAG: DNA polymerase III subunit delta' [Firmicutes bacterium]|nr:DNA polymerase III subunit delta' [Bacillota bacterium]